MTVGSNVGKGDVGDKVGGEVVGDAVGTSVFGLAVGNSVVSDGGSTPSNEGNRVAPSKGAPVGCISGTSVGDPVGLLEGEMDGVWVVTVGSLVVGNRVG